MKKIYLQLLSIIIISEFSIAHSAKAQTFTNGNLAVFVAAASASNTTGSIVELNTSSSGQSAINTFAVPSSTTTLTNQLRFSGSATSTMYLSNSNDGSLLCFAGGNTINTASNINTITNRGVGTFNHSGTYNLATTYTGVTGNQTRSASSTDNSTWYVGDQGGFYTNSSVSSSPAGNIRGVKSFGGTVYAFTASASAAPVGTISAATGGTFTALPGLATGASSRQDFYLVSSGTNGSSFDVLYVLDATSATAGTIFKYSLVSGTWTANGTYTTSFGGFGLAAQASGSGAFLYVSSGTGATAANNLIKLTDAAGYNSTISITTGSNIILYTSATGTIIKGVAFAPICNAPAINSLSVNGPICEGTSLNFLTTTTGTAPLNYAWTGPNGFTSSLQNPVLSNALAAANGTYSLTVTNACGSASSTVQATVNSLPTATITPDAATTFCAGDSVHLTASSATSYLWSTGATTQIITATTAGNYSVTVTDGNGCSANSAVTSVAVNPNVTPTINITANPGSTICSGTNVTFNSSIMNGGASPLYQWTLNGGNIGTGTSYSNNTLTTGDVIVCTLTSNAACITSATAISNTITVTVSTVVVPSISIASTTGNTNCDAATVTFNATVTNEGITPTYQWQVNGANVGASNAAYSTNALVDQDIVTCILTSSDACANPTTVPSNSLTMTVTPNITPSVNIVASTGNIICSGTSVIFTANAINGGIPIYQWTKNRLNVGTNNATYTDAALANNDTISCIMASTATCRMTSTAVSSDIIMTVNSLPATPAIIGTLSFCSGNTSTLDAGAAYASYLWSTGETTQTISVNSATNFSVTVSDGTCNASSAPVSTTLMNTPNSPASFTTNSAYVSIGQTGVAYTVPNDLNAVSYNWSYSGIGATINGSGNSITIDFSSSATAGTLSVTATNSCGTSTATSMNVTINPSSFTQGNFVVLQTSNTTSKASSPITLAEYTTNGVAGASITLPSTGSTPIQTAGVFGGSEGFLTTSTDGKFLVLTGYGTSASFGDITGTTAASVARVIGTISQSGSYTQVASSNSFYTLNDIRGAVSDGTNFWASGASAASADGIDYFGPGTQAGLGTALTPPKGYGIRIFNGQIYYSTQKAGPSNTVSQLGIFSLSGGTPTSGTVTMTQIINTGTTIVEDFSFNPTTDVCYIAVNLNTATGGIQKWVNTAGTWDLAYTLGTGIINEGAYGLLVDYSGSNPILYATTFDAGGNRIIKITDTGAGSAATTIVPAVAGVYYKGISFAPVDAGIPTVNISLSTNAGSETAATVVTISVTSSSPVVGNQSVSLTISGTGITMGDYTLSNATVTIPSGATVGTATFTIIDDAIVEGNETAALTISNPSPGILLGSITSQNILITDNDGNNPPSIVMNVATTTNYIDGGALTSPASPYSVSGGSADPTDPARTLGIDFTVNDFETAAGSLTVSAISSNTLVVPFANLIITGSGAIRNIKITPSNIGYSDITVTVHDGTDSASYVINYASSDQVPFINTNNTFWHTGMSDGSDAVAIDDDYYMSGDDELDVVNVYSRYASGLPMFSFNFASYLNLPDPSKPEVDTEAGTRSPKNANRSYWLGSMSNGKSPFDNKPNRDRLLATTHANTGAATTISFSGYCAIRTALIAWGDSYGYNFSASAAAGVDSKSPAGFSAEGMVFGPDSTTLWIGLRAPLVPTAFRTKAVIAPILNFETWFNNGSQTGSPTFGAPIELDLGINGIRDIIRLSNGTYVIIAGSPLDNGGTNSIYKWTGSPADAPVSITSAGDGIINMEGAMEVHTGGNLSLTKLQVVSDYGSNVLYGDGTEAKEFGDLNLRKFRSDVLTSLDLDICSGYSSAITATGNTTFCQGDSVKLTATNNIASYLWSDGETTSSIFADTTGNYTVVVTKANTNCSYTSAPKTVTVNSLPIPTITQAGSLLSSSVATTYQWYFNGTLIAGATSQNYTATQNGNYSVAVTNAAGCEGSSAPLTVNPVGIDNISNSANSIIIYPNPYQESTSIQVTLAENATVSIEVYSVLGQKIQYITNMNYAIGRHSFTFSAKQLGYSAGVYFVRTTINNKITVSRIIEND